MRGREDEHTNLLLRSVSDGRWELAKGVGNREESQVGSIRWIDEEHGETVATSIDGKKILNHCQLPHAL